MNIKILIFISAILLIQTSCSSTKSGTRTSNAYQTPTTHIKSFNDYDLEVSQDGITYTIDISTPEGKTKLKNLSLHEAEELALTEAVIKYNCAMLVNPQYTNLMKGKRVLRITVFGFPAKFKNSNNQQIQNNGNIKNVIIN